MEIIIKAKQKFNPFFSFLSREDVLYPYYKHLKELISMGSYIPQVKTGEAVGSSVGAKQEPAESNSETTQQETTIEVESNFEEASVPEVESKTEAVRRDSKLESEIDSDEDSEDGGYLHPLLSGTSSGKDKTTPTTAATPEITIETSRTNSDHSNRKKLSMDEILNLHKPSASFLARSMAVNPAPPTSLASEGEATQAHQTDADREAMAAYEFYRQQYYNR